MTNLRFQWQREQAAKAAVRAPDKKILNVACKEDPGEIRLVSFNVVNCDREATSTLDGSPNKTHVLFDVRERWPFEDDEAELTILGEILEHLTPEEQVTCLNEAFRVSATLAVTTPEDPRFLAAPTQPGALGPGHEHITLMTAPFLKEQLERAGWEPVEWETVDYEIPGVEHGFFVACIRSAR